MRPLASKLRDRVRIDERVEVDTPLGRQETSWTERETVWGLLVPLSVANRAELQQLGHSTVTHRIYFRGRVDIEPDSNRFVIGSTAYRPLELVHQDVQQGRFGHVLVGESIGESTELEEEEA